MTTPSASELTRADEKWLDLDEYIRRLADHPKHIQGAKVRFIARIGRRYGILLVRADRKLRDSVGIPTQRNGGKDE